MDGAAIFEWLELLDELDYYALLAIDASATADDVKRAFHTFATTFHPDGHPGRPVAERSALDAIFKRGTEAYMILSDPTLRDRYDAQLASATRTSARMISVPPQHGESRASQLPPRLEDRVRTSSARPFARRAEELVEAGDLKQAKLQLVMAKHHDPDNADLEDYLSRVDFQIKTKT